MSQYLVLDGFMCGCGNIDETILECVEVAIVFAKLDDIR